MRILPCMVAYPVLNSTWLFFSILLRAVLTPKIPRATYRLESWVIVIQCGLIQTRCIVSVVGRIAVFHVTWHVPLDRRSVVQRLVLRWRLPVRAPSVPSPTSDSRPRYVPASGDRVSHHALQNSSSTHWRTVPRRRLRSRLAHRALPRYVTVRRRASNRQWSTYNTYFIFPVQTTLILTHHN